MAVYVLNTLVVPVNFDEHFQVRVKLRKVSINEAKEILAGGFISAVGHEATAKLLSQLLGIQVPMERRTVFLRPGDMAIHFFLKSRLPEGVVLTEEQLRSLDFWLVLSEVEQSP
jgi:hypothetical protein